jgi:glycosyltransferase involved in cell wall biosynthesis
MGVQVIHFVMGKANPDRMNGVNKVVHHLAEHQAAAGAHVRIWGLTHTPDDPLPKRTVTTRLFQNLGWFRLDPSLRSALAALAGGGTVIHIHGGFIPQFSIAARLMVRHGIPFIYTPHGAHNRVAMERSAWKKRVYIPLFEAYLVRHARCLHFIGESEVAGSELVFGKRTHVLIPNGEYMPAAPLQARSRDAGGHTTFGTVGRLDMHTKGLDKLLEGFAEFIRSAPAGGMLWLVGDGPDRGRLERMADRLGIREKVIFHGPRFGAEKNALIARMDLFCLTSRNEGLPGVVLEAAALGVPALVSRATNMAGHIARYQAGPMLPVDTANGIAQGLMMAHHLAGTPTWDAMRMNARTMVAREFNWTTIASRHLALYHA